MSTALLWQRWPRNVEAGLASVAVLAALSFTSCNRLRSPQELLHEPSSQADPRLAARAEKLYQRNCAICHGEAGEGDGQYFASDLQPTPSDLTGKGPDALDLADLQRWIREGSSGFGRSKLCPPWGHTLTTEETAALARFVLSLRDARPLANP